MAAIALVCASNWTPPDALRAMSAAVADWSSIILAAIPYIVAGAVAARCSQRLIGQRWRNSEHAIALLAVLNPGCDCALNGFAGALARLHPAVAGFALTFAAAASPVSLAVTYAAFGTHMTIARAAGALLAATLTAAAWSASVVPTFMVGRKFNNVGPTFIVGHEFDNVGPTFMVGREFDNVGPTFTVGQPMMNIGTTLVDDLAAALSGVAYAATAAVAVKLLVPAALFAHVAPAGAALLGALLSPCSTADPLMAATFLRDARAQLAFMLAAQCLDVRQLLLILRHFGVSRMIAAALCAACACAVAMVFA
ncbi:MAG TPA: hypothetical protein VID19_05060 [Candidatus Eremiobacteraceae bacterium]